MYRAEGWGVLTFPTNKFLLAATVAGRDRPKKSSEFVGTVGMEWGGRPGNKGPVTNQCDVVKSAIPDDQREN